MGTVNRTVVSLRALFDQIDSDVASEIRSGEDHVMTAFDEAIRHSAGEPIRTELSRMRDELAALVAGLPNED